MTLITKYDVDQAVLNWLVTLAWLDAGRDLAACRLRRFLASCSCCRRSRPSGIAQGPDIT